MDSVSHAERLGPVIHVVKRDISAVYVHLHLERIDAAQHAAYSVPAVSIEHMVQENVSHRKRLAPRQYADAPVGDHRAVIITSFFGCRDFPSGFVVRKSQDKPTEKKQ